LKEFFSRSIKLQGKLSKTLVQKENGVEKRGSQFPWVYAMSEHVVAGGIQGELNVC